MRLKLTFAFFALLAFALTFAQATTLSEAPILVTPSSNQYNGGVLAGAQASAPLAPEWYVVPAQVEIPGITPARVEDPNTVPVAPVEEEEILVVAVQPRTSSTAVAPAPNSPSVQFDLISPDNNEVFQMTSNINIDFSFVATPYDFEDQTTYISSCKISIRNADSALPTIELDTSFNQATGAGNIQYLFSEAGQYFWRVICLSSDGADWNSNELPFSIIRAAPIAPVENEQPSNNNNNNPTNTNNNNNGDSNGRRLQPISLPLQDLSNTADDSEDQESSPGITAAVIGAIGKKGLTGIIILVVVVGAAGLVIYNRRKLGVVKA